MEGGGKATLESGQISGNGAADGVFPSGNSREVYSGGVQVDGTDSIFVMNGGAVTGNNLNILTDRWGEPNECGAGINAGEETTVEIKRGEISGNSTYFKNDNGMSSNGKAAYMGSQVWSGGALTITGGLIDGTSVQDAPEFQEFKLKAAVSCDGFYNQDDLVFKMTGGEIKGGLASAGVVLDGR